MVVKALTLRMSQGKFVHVSFRILVEVMADLTREAKRRAINVNALVGQILAKYASFDRIVEHVEAVPLNKLLFMGMLDAIEIGEMERLGRELGPRLVKKTFAFLSLEFDIDGLIQNYFLPVSMYSRWYSFNIAGSGANRRLMFEHPYGPKWSAFLKQYIAGIIKSATGSEPRITVDEGLVTIFC
jgi:hypothetical protein